MVGHFESSTAQKMFMVSSWRVYEDVKNACAGAQLRTKHVHRETFIISYYQIPTMQGRQKYYFYMEVDPVWFGKIL